MKFEIDENGVLTNIIDDSQHSDSVIIPSNVKVISSSAFNKVKHVKKIVVPKPVEIIESNAFCNLTSLTYISLPSTLKKIEFSTFDGCESIKKLTLPKGIEEIGEYAFSRCENMVKIQIPTFIKNLPKGLFLSCHSLEKVKLGNNIETIGRNAFSKCRKLKSIKLPSSLKKIEHGAFSNSGIRKIKIPNSVNEIDEKVFFNCIELEEVVLPSSLKKLKNDVFSYCNKLKYITLPETLESIEKNAFARCLNLENITLPKRLKYIGERAFSHCFNLRHITLPETLERIEKDTFMYCKNLESVTLPNTLRYIGSGAFCICSNLKQVDIPPKVEVIDELAFCSCTNLKKITIPASVKKIHPNAMNNCPNLKEIKLGNIFQLKDAIKESIFKHFYYNDETMEIIESVEEKKKLKGYRKIDVVGTCEKFGCGILEAIFIDAFFNKLDSGINENLEFLLPLLLQNADINNYTQIFQIIDNSKEFTNLLKQLEDRRNRMGSKSIRSIYDYDLLKLALSLGAFSKDKTQRQRACEFLHNAIDKKDIRYHYIHQEFESLKFGSYNEEWAEFFMNKENFHQLIEMEKNYDTSGIICRIHNNFENIREFGRSNRGNQRYRKVTINMAKEYFEKNTFHNINEQNEDIANTIKAYTRNQEAFDNASSIREEYLRLKQEEQIQDHLLEEELKEIREEIIEDSEETLKNLNETLNNCFTYEYLSKYDPDNFILGKYCACCAHLEGAGYGIMKASILHPDCQNIVIRDKNGKIVAKSTLYINREQGYGVCNNVEVSTNIKQNQIQAIYKKYTEAIQEFVTRYNKKNVNKPITQINVGMNLNDLGHLIKENHTKANNILQGISFCKYGRQGQLYNGDWQAEQYIIYNKTKENKKH